jgi:sugar phosphate isomerase/epimerase
MFNLTILEVLFMKSCLFIVSLDSFFAKGLSLHEAVDMVVEYGIDAIEPYPVNELSEYNLSAAKAFGEYCCSKKVSIPCFSMLGSLESLNYKEEVERLKGFIEMAAAMGAEMFHHTLVPSLKHNAAQMPLYKEIMPQLISACEELCDYASRYNITCVYEDQGFVINGINAYEEFYLNLNRANKGVVADLGNILFVGEEPQDFTGHFAPLVKHVHVKDYLVKPGSGQFPGEGWYLSANGDYLRGTIIGHGTIDFIQTIKILLRADYNGYYSIEFDGAEPPEDAITYGLENLRYYFEEAKRQLAFCDDKILV